MTQEFELELGSEHIRAMRVFLVDRNKLLLTSIGGSREVWTPGEIKRSVCLFAKAHGHLKPEPLCTCGIWSCTSRKNLEKTFPAIPMQMQKPVQFSFGGWSQELLVSAQIEQWGIVIEHQWGYRSEYARIIPETIQVYPRRQQHHKLIKHLREKYDPIPV